MDKNLVNFIVSIVNTEAIKAKNDAAYGGSHNDGGSSEMLSKLHY